MSTLTAVALGSGVGLGLLLCIAGLRGSTVLPTAALTPGHAARKVGSASNERRLWLVAGTVGAVAWLATGWFAAGLIAVSCAYVLPKLFGGQAARREWIAKTEAIAAWTEMLRDTMAAADGVEEAIAATVRIAPAPIRRQVGMLDARRRSEHTLPEALAQFAVDVDHPSADLVVAALSIAAEGEGSDFVGVLTRLATMTRDEVRMRLRVEAGRAQLHTASRIIVGVLGLSVLALTVFSRGYLEPYSDPTGQLWLVMVGAFFVAGVLMLDRMSHIELPERFSPRRVGRGSGAAGRSGGFRS
jgi:tight adherence protein B